MPALHISESSPAAARRGREDGAAPAAPDAHFGPGIAPRRGVWISSGFRGDAGQGGLAGRRVRGAGLMIEGEGGILRSGRIANSSACATSGGKSEIAHDEVKPHLPGPRAALRGKTPGWSFGRSTGRCSRTAP